VQDFKEVKGNWWRRVVAIGKRDKRKEEKKYGGKGLEVLANRRKEKKMKKEKKEKCRLVVEMVNGNWLHG
jgi:hypothetical protein